MKKWIRSGKFRGYKRVVMWAKDNLAMETTTIYGGGKFKSSPDPCFGEGGFKSVYSSFNEKAKILDGFKEKFAVDFQSQSVFFTVCRKKDFCLISEVFLWSLSGELDDGRSIHVEAIEQVQADYSEYTIVFKSIGKVIINKPNKNCIIKKVKYHLIGIFNYEGSVESSDWRIDIVDSSKPILQLVKDNCTLNDYNKKAIEIAKLLSFATGNGVVYYKSFVYYNHDDVMEVYNKMVGGEEGPGTVVPNRVLTRFLKEALNSEYRSKQKVIYLAIEHLNLLKTKSRFDEMIFSTVQTLEFIADVLIEEEKKELDNYENGLLKELKDVHKEYRKVHLKNTKENFYGYIGKRIENIFFDAPLKYKIKSLIEKQGILVREPSLALTDKDFKELVKLRNNYVHRGRLHNDNPHCFKLLKKAIFNIRLVLLVEFGYSGMITFEGENNWRKFDTIDHFLRK